MTAAVAIENVTFRYPGGKAGVFDLSLAIEPGELAVCIGPSGCGKTTLLKLIAGFLRPDAGVVRLHGEDVSATSVRDRQCGIVFQSYALFPHMQVWENVAYPLRVRDVAVAERRKRAGELLDLVGLGGLGERFPAALSGGQQQRVALARALAFAPRVLLLDEPLSALDAATRVAMRDEVRRIQKSQNIAALLITHDQDEALSLADRVAVLRDGRLQQYDTPAAIYDRPASGFVASFVGRANIVAARTIAVDAVETPFGRLATRPHAAGSGAEVRLLIRPERIEPVGASATGENVFAVTVRRDRFFGASRQVELGLGASGTLELATAERGPIGHIRVPRDAIQFLAS
jgi:putative spermidine/putrescine transport system ATP-binding protein